MDHTVPGSVRPDPHISYKTFTGWIERPRDLAPPLRESITCDVVVVGGGLGGMAAALHLAEHGVDVTLVETDFCGFGASSRNAGQLSGKPGGDPQVLSKLYPDRLRQLISLTENAVSFVESTLTKYGIDCEYDPVGNVGAAITPAHMRKAERNCRILREAGLDERFGTAADLGIPRTFLGGSHAPLGGTMNPGTFTMGMRRAVMSSDARLYENTPALSVQDTGGGTIVTTPEGEIRAKHAIIANNAYAQELSITPKNLTKPVWVNMIETAPIDGHRIEEIGWTSRAGLATVHNVMESYHLTPRNTVVVGVRQLQVSRAPANTRISDTAVVKDLANAFRLRFPSLTDIPIERTWGGWIAMTSSWLPVAGQVTPRIDYMIGCNGHGLGQAPYLGDLMARRIVNAELHHDLRAIWRQEPKFRPSPYLHRGPLRAAWIADRIADRLHR